MKTIALIDLFSGGHRDAFMRLFVEACLELDTRVICIFPESGKIEQWVVHHYPDREQPVIFINHQPALKKFKKMGRFNDALSCLFYWKSCGTLLKEIEKNYGLKIDLVFFNWLDSQMANNLPAKLTELVFPFKWSGIYFHPAVFRTAPAFLTKKPGFRDIDSVFLSKNCVAVSIHDEGILEKYQKRIGKKTMLFPEIADSTPPNPGNLLAKSIKEKANGRTIVGLIGLEPYKGTLNMMRLAGAASPSDFFFAFTGYYKESFLDSLCEKERKEYIDFMTHLPENCFWQTGSLQEGAEYNAVFCSFDIIHIVYKNFYSSSNRLTKAAIFNKLVLASNNGCVGDDVPAYQLGETADENNIEEQKAKLEMLRNKILAKDFPYEQWKRYAEKHNTDRLKEKFRELLNLV